MSIFSICYGFLTTILIVNGQVHNNYNNDSQSQKMQGDRAETRRIFKIGGLFDDDADPLEENAFKQAVQRLNTEGNFAHVSVRIVKVPTGNPFHAHERVCKLVKEEIVAIFGPQSPEVASHVQSICDALEIPYIETRWDHRIRGYQYMINLHPYPATLSRAYRDLVEAFDWKVFVVLYESGNELHDIEEVLKSAGSQERKIIIKKLPSGKDYRPLLKDMLSNPYLTNFVIACEATTTHEVLQQAQQVGMINFRYSFILTTLDIHTMVLDDFRHAQSNITSFRLIDPERPELKRVVHEWNEISGHFANSRMISTQTALIYDAMQLLGTALGALESRNMIQVQALNCDNDEIGQEGYNIINYMKMSEIMGLSGLIKFDNSGFRTDVSLDVVKLTADEGLKKIGVWDASRYSHSKFNWSLSHFEAKSYNDETDDMPLSNRTMVVTMIKVAPFCMLKSSILPLAGNARYEGFSISLLEQLSKILQFKYVIQEVADGQHGSYNHVTGWNGMIREVIDGKADMVIADLAINGDRQKAVDFSMPFMNSGISILHTTPKAKPPSLFSFMSPFSPDLWICLGLSFLGVSVILFLIARISPCERDNSHLSKEKHVQFTLQNSFWFTFGSITQQGSDLAPKAISTRMIAGIWWFFTLIMVSSYTASLAQFLIVQDLDLSINSLYDLAKQTRVRYGCVKGGATCNFFKESDKEIYKHVWNNMGNMRPSPLKKDYKEGVEAVLSGEGKYAFFMESTLIEYNIEKKCGLAQIGGRFDNKGYGVVLPKGSPYMSLMSSAILKLQEEGVLDELKRKWWKEEGKEKTCPGASVTDSVSALKLANVGGVFVVLVSGCLVAVVLTCVEVLWKAREIPVNPGESRTREVLKDIQFALQCRGNIKQVRKQSSEISTVGRSGKDLGSTYADL